MVSLINSQRTKQRGPIHLSITLEVFVRIVRWKKRKVVIKKEDLICRSQNYIEKSK